MKYEFDLQYKENIHVDCPVHHRALFIQIFFFFSQISTIVKRKYIIEIVEKMNGLNEPLNRTVCVSFIIDREYLNKIFVEIFMESVCIVCKC